MCGKYNNGLWLDFRSYNLAYVLQFSICQVMNIIHDIGLARQFSASTDGSKDNQSVNRISWILTHSAMGKAMMKSQYEVRNSHLTGHNG